MGKDRKPATKQAPRAGKSRKKAAAQQADKQPEHSEAALREQIAEELQEQMAVERFQQEHPELWLQASRLGRLMDLQDHCDDGHFPAGSCFLYANVPGFQCFAVKRVLAVDLDTCQASVEIFGDGDLEPGTVLLPLEGVSWYGFPEKAIPLSFAYSGFTTSRPMGG